MRFTIGKKIGAGFLFLLLLSTIVSGIMYSAIQLGIDVSSKISTERFPRYNINTSLQKQLLTAGYKVRIFFDTSNEEALKEYTDVTEEVLRKDIRKFIQLLDDNYMLDSGKPEPIMGMTKIRMTEKEQKRLQEQKKNG